MFKLFSPRSGITLSPRSVHLIRADTLDLIHIANHSEQTTAGRAKPGGVTGRRRTLELHAVASAERRLAGSIATAVSKSVNVQLIVESAIEPVLSESLLVSTFARACIGRALDMAGRH